MRKRDIRSARKERNRERWRELWAPADVAQSDEAWRDAIAEHASRSLELEQRNFSEARRNRK